MANTTNTSTPNWTSIILNALMQGGANYMASKEQKNVANAASKPQTTYSSKTPYGNAYISQLLPYLFGEGVNIYQKISGLNGREAGQIDLGKLFSNIPQGYSGVGGNTSGPTAYTLPSSMGGNSDTPSYGSASGSGAYGDMGARGSSLDSMLTPEQRTNSSYDLSNVNMEDIKNGAGKLLHGAGKQALETALSTFGGPIGGLVAHLVGSFGGQSGHGENKFLQMIPSVIQKIEQQGPKDLYSSANAHGVPPIDIDNLYNHRDSFDGGGLDPRQLDFYNGTKNPWDWGDNAYQDGGRHNTGGNWGGAGGGFDFGPNDIWSMFRGNSY